jgi:solute carrier family 8 (sodium/calcium exchanger)
VFLIKVISGITIVSVPTGELKRIDDMGVFITTAIFSIFAYIWMFIVLKVWSPDVVEIAEAILTLVFFILLVVLAFAADKYNEIKKKKLAKENNQMAEKEGLTRDEFYRIVGVRNSQAQPTSKRNQQLRPIKEDPLESSQITQSQKDVEGENLNKEEFKGSQKKIKSVRDTIREGETRKVMKKVTVRTKVKD